jgi:prepilin-type N-terminal cleavage/methylation domain-containing protein
MNHNSAGFTLIELAVVLIIVSLLLGGLLVPLGTQISQRNVQTTQGQLEEIREALLGFAVVNGRLPCPTTTTNPTNPQYGLEDASCSLATDPSWTAVGYLPWKTLGVAAYDAWGVGRNAAADPWTGYFRYRVHPNFANSASPISMSTNFAIGGAPNPKTFLIVDSAGNALSRNPAAPASTDKNFPVAIVYSTGANTTADGQNASFNVLNGPYSATYQGGQITSTFDDLTIWISTPLLYNRMIAAGRIP